MNWWKRLMEKLAQANQENLPTGEKLDCCNINQSNKMNHQSKAKDHKKSE